MLSNSRAPAERGTDSSRPGGSLRGWLSAAIGVATGKARREAIARAQSAEAASRAKDELIATLGHEVRNRLGAISAAVDVLENAGTQAATAAEALAIIARQTRALSHMMNELRDASRRESAWSAVPLPQGDPAPALADDLLPQQLRRRVLLVDDDERDLAALRARLEREGHTVSTAADGHEGLNRLLSQRPQVSIVDIGLHGITGLELARHARAAGYAGRMIALSAPGDEGDMASAMAAGFDVCLIKPVERMQLRASMSD